MTWIRDAVGLKQADLDAIEKHVTEYTADWKQQQRENERAKAKDADEYDLDQSMAEKALGGVYGARCREIAQSHVDAHGRSAKSLRSLRRALGAVEGRQCG